VDNYGLSAPEFNHLLWRGTAAEGTALCFFLDLPRQCHAQIYRFPSHPMRDCKATPSFLPFSSHILLDEPVQACKNQIMPLEGI